MYTELEDRDVGQNAKCPLCNAFVLHYEDFRTDIELVICPTCGKFRIGGMAQYWLRGLDDQQRKRVYKVSFALRGAAERALGKVDNSNFPVYGPESLEKMILAPEPSVQEKLAVLLNFLSKRTQYPGQSIMFDGQHDYSVVCAQNPDEAAFYLNTLSQQGLIRTEAPVLNPTGTRLVVTAQGWHEITRLEREISESSRGFIAMAFSPDRDAFGNAISAAIRASGYKPVRVDQVEHVNRIDDEIIAQIRASKFLVADFTLQRNGVYFEAGLMLGLGRPVIWVCEKEDLKNVHFDTRQYNTIDYADDADLGKRLQTRIEAVLGRGPLASISEN
jgi:hypothetical protein